MSIRLKAVCFEAEVSAPSARSAVAASLPATGCARRGTTSTIWPASPVTRASDNSALAKSSPYTRTAYCARRTTSRSWTGAAHPQTVSSLQLVTHYWCQHAGPRCGWEDNIKMDFLYVGWSKDLINLAQHMDRWVLYSLSHITDVNMLGPGVDGRIILKWIFYMLDGARTWLIWLSIGTGGGLLWMRWWTFGFHKMWGIFWLVEDLLASQEGLCSMELVQFSYLC